MLSDINQVRIVYYSGTGNAQKVAGCFEDFFAAKGVSTQKYSVFERNRPRIEAEDLLVLVYAVHGMNAPEGVYGWIRDLPAVNKARAAVISVSGGGEVIPNTACRVGCIQRLEKKGYSVTYEKMLVMPSNWITATQEALAAKLLEVLPDKVKIVVDEVLSGIRRRSKPLLVDRFLSWAGELEKVGARQSAYMDVQRKLSHRA